MQDDRYDTSCRHDCDTQVCDPVFLLIGLPDALLIMSLCCSFLNYLRLNYIEFGNHLRASAPYELENCFIIIWTSAVLETSEQAAKQKIIMFFFIFVRLN